MADPTPTPLTDAERRMGLRGYPGAQADIDNMLAAARADERERITAAVLAVVDRNEHDEVCNERGCWCWRGDIRAALAQPTGNEEPDHG